MRPTELKPGDRVALLLPSSETYVDLVVDLLAVGVFPFPLDPRLTRAELDPVLANVRPSLVVDSVEQADRLRAVVSAGPTGAGRLPLGRPMHVTSGTTGRPVCGHPSAAPAVGRRSALLASSVRVYRSLSS